MILPVCICIFMSSLVPGLLGARILAVIPFLGKSHHIFTSSVLKILAGRGHQVVEYSPFPPESPTANYTHVEVLTEVGNLVDYDTLKRESYLSRSLQKTLSAWGINYAVCEKTFKHNNIKKLLSSNEHVDLVITESSFGQESLLAFGHRFSAPTVTIETSSPWSAVYRDAGNSLAMAYAPELRPFVAMDRMSFKERLLNCISVLWTLYFYYNSHIPRQQAILNTHYPDAPPLAEMIGNVSLYFTNTQPTAHYIRPFTPNIIPIGGIQINDEKIQLPKDVKQFMDDAKDGVIYFSLGSVVPVHTIPREILQIFINVFEKLPQRVIWKIGIDSLPQMSKNIMIRKWLPQLGILAHPNCVLFLTHGGVFSQQEAIYTGVPTVGIPFFADQPFNIRFNEHHGIGVKLDFDSFSEENVYNALTSVLYNSSYKDNALKMSRIYRDRPLEVSEQVVFWVEYVLRHRGAPHLRPVSAHMSWYQLASVDVVSVSLGMVAIVSVVLVAVVKHAWSFCLRKLRKEDLNKKIQ